MPRGRDQHMRVGIAHRFGWAVAVTASGDQVVDRRRIELIEPGMPTAPIHHDGGPHALHQRAAPLDDDELARLVADVRSSITRSTAAAFDALTNDIREPIVSISLRAWGANFPADVATQRRVPYESHADSTMYRKILTEQAHVCGWLVHCFDAKTVQAHATRVLGTRADNILNGPRATLGPPWMKDHRIAFAARSSLTDRNGIRR